MNSSFRGMLAEHGHRLSPGTLYPALARMEKNRWLERTRGAQVVLGREPSRLSATARRKTARETT
jgi:DNA-binding PadR family transcriptional regulator